MPLDPAKMEFLELWAARNKCYVQVKGEVGFGRPCVGICFGQSYVDLPQYPHEAEHGSDEMTDYYSQTKLLPSAPEDAYHKHDCLAVLVHNDDYDKALEQLWDWVGVLSQQGWTVRIQDRNTYNKEGFGMALELMMGGTQQAVLELKK